MRASGINKNLSDAWSTWERTSKVKDAVTFMEMMSAIHWAMWVDV